MKRKDLFYFLISLLLFLVIILCVLIFANNSVNSQLVGNTVLDVIDGDTFEIYDAETRSVETVRLLCVDTPEKGEEGYEDAKMFLKYKILGKQVELVSSVTNEDKYTRLLRYVYVDDLFINKLVIDEGYGELLIVPPEECKELIE